MIPLDSDDLIGCLLRHPSWTAGWIPVVGVIAGFVHIPPGVLYERSIPLTTLQIDAWTYHRIGNLDTEGKPVWRRCEKEATK